MAAVDLFMKLDAKTFDHASDMNASDVMRSAILAIIYELNQ